MHTATRASKCPHCRGGIGPGDRIGAVRLPSGRTQWRHLACCPAPKRDPGQLTLPGVVVPGTVRDWLERTR